MNKDKQPDQDQGCLGIKRERDRGSGGYFSHEIVDGAGITKMYLINKRDMALLRLVTSIEGGAFDVKDPLILKL